MDDQKKANPQTNDGEQGIKSLLVRIQKRFYRIPITRRVIGGALLGVLIIGAVARWLPDMKDRMKFFADSSLSWLIFVIVAVQAYIYGKQWKVMDKQVVFGLRAYVGVKDISDIDFNNKRISFHIENIGKVPAKDINVSIEVEVRIPEKWADGQSKQPPWVRLANLSQSLTWKANHDYGRIRLSPGSFGLAIPVSLSWLSNGHMLLIWEDKAEIFFRGNIGFHDGFHRGKNSPFSFRYIRRQEAWITHPILTRADIEEKLAERTKKYFGDKDPLAGVKIHTTYQPPLKPAKTEETKGEDKGEAN